MEPGHRDARRRVAAALALDVVWRSNVVWPTVGHARTNLDPHGRVWPREPERVLVSSLLALGFIPRWSAQQFPVTGPVDGIPRDPTAEVGRGPLAAIAAYRRSHAIVPTMNNLSLRLAALLFLGNARTEGYEILDAAFKVAEPPRDLLITLERGDARFVSDHITAMRAALK